MANRGDGTRNIVVVGASAGGVEAMTRLVTALPADFPGAILVVLHVAPTGSVLPQILTRAGLLNAHHATDGESLENGQIVVAPPDYHMLVDDSSLRVSRGPRENGYRPAIDPLFRTAAAAHGASVTGVILSGSLDDGTAGLQAVKRFGGMTIVQDPEEALYRAMPQSAIDAVGPDFVLPVSEIAALLADPNGPGPTPKRRREEELMSTENDPTQLDPVALAKENARAGRVSGFTCPECNGALWEVEDEGVVKLRCRVGHTYTEEGYEHEKGVALEAALWTAMTALVEKSEFLSRMAKRFRSGGHDLSAARYDRQADLCLEKAEEIRSALLELGVPAVEPEEGAQVS